MRLRSVVSMGVLGVLVATAGGCAGSSSSQPPAGLSVTGTAMRASAAAPSRGAQRLNGARRNVSGCTGTGTNSFVGGTDLNVAAGGASGVLSGELNDACDGWSGVGAGDGNIINSSGASNDEFIGAGTSNAITRGTGTFIGAGGSNAINTGDYAFIGGGFSNTISAGHYSFIGAGQGNSINGGIEHAVIGGGSSNTNTANEGVVAGGQGNTVSNQFGSVGGGESNKVSGEFGTAAGGFGNTASGTESTVPGGGNNIASGYASFAAGSHADADEGGSFVWSDSSSSSTTKATATNQFVARASGGVEFFSNSALTTGVSLAAGGGSWASVSDRAVKTDVESIDDAQILERVAAMPISEWSYISERGVRHVGPMAQDFYAAFGVGEDDKHITSIDEDGVALAAIKALNVRLAQKDAALHVLQRQMAAMFRHNAVVEQRLAQLGARVAALH